MKIGFIGLGNMGSGMARNLIKAGHDVTAYNRTRDRAAQIVSAGGRIAEDPAEAASSAISFLLPWPRAWGRPIGLRLPAFLTSARVFNLCGVDREQPVPDFPFASLLPGDPIIFHRPFISSLVRCLPFMDAGDRIAGSLNLHPPVEKPCQTKD